MVYEARDESAFVIGPFACDSSDGQEFIRTKSLVWIDIHFLRKCLQDAFSGNEYLWQQSNGTVGNKFRGGEPADTFLLCNHYHADVGRESGHTHAVVHLEPAAEHPATKIAHTIYAATADHAVQVNPKEYAVTGYVTFEEPFNLTVFAYKPHGHYPSMNLIRMDLLFNKSGHETKIASTPLHQTQSDAVTNDDRVLEAQIGDSIEYICYFVANEKATDHSSRFVERCYSLF